MYKLTLIVLMMTVWMSLQVMQTDEELAMKLLVQSKNALNRATHAAAQQLDSAALSEGIVRIDPDEAEQAAWTYLNSNLLLDSEGKPLPNSPIREPVEVLVFEVINEGYSFPYLYRNDTYNYEATLLRPGVVMIVRVEYPRAFKLLEPIEWYIRGVSELVLSY